MASTKSVRFMPDLDFPESSCSIVDANVTIYDTRIHSCLSEKSSICKD